MWSGRLENVPSPERPRLGPGAWHCHRLWPGGVVFETGTVSLTKEARHSVLDKGGACAMIYFCEVRAWDFLWAHMQPWWAFGGPSRWPWHRRPLAPPRSPVPRMFSSVPVSAQAPPPLCSARGSWSRSRSGSGQQAHSAHSGRGAATRQWVWQQRPSHFLQVMAGSGLKELLREKGGNCRQQRTLSGWSLPGQLSEGPASSPRQSLGSFHVSERVQLYIQGLALTADRRLLDVPVWNE